MQLSGGIVATMSAGLDTIKPPGSIVAYSPKNFLRLFRAIETDKNFLGPI
jgi:hypothetical protein